MNVVFAPTVSCLAPLWQPSASAFMKLSVLLFLHCFFLLHIKLLTLKEGSRMLHSPFPTVLLHLVYLIELIKESFFSLDGVANSDVYAQPVCYSQGTRRPMDYAN